MPCDGMGYHFDKEKNVIRIPFSKTVFATILKYRHLSIDINNKIYLKRFRFVFSDKPIFKPNLTTMNIWKRYLRKRKMNKEILFSLREPFKINEALEVKILQNLIFRALRGDRNAERIFLNYTPNGMDKSELVACLQDWYLFVKGLR